MLNSKILFCLCLLIPTVVRAEPFTIAIGEFPPYVSESYPEYGFFGELTTRALELEGHSVDFIFYPWRRAYILTQAGDVDATLPWTNTADRHESFLYSKPILNGNVILFFNKGKKRDWLQLEDLTDLTFGSISGYHISNTLTQMIDDGRLTSATASDEVSSFKMLGAGRIDVIAQDRNLGLDIIKTLKSSGFEMSHFEIGDQIIDSVPSYLIAGKVNPKSTILIESFNNGLNKLIESGEFEKLLDKHNIKQ